MRLLYDPDLVKPEMCSLDCSLIGTSWGDRTFVYEWYRPFLLKYARKMRDMGIKPELECFNPESVEDVFNVLVPAGVLEEPSHSPLSWVWTASARAPSPSPRRTWTS